MEAAEAFVVAVETELRTRGWTQMTSFNGRRVKPHTWKRPTYVEGLCATVWVDQYPTGEVNLSLGDSPMVFTRQVFSVFDDAQLRAALALLDVPHGMTHEDIENY